MNPNSENVEILEWENGRLRHLLVLAWPIAVSMVSYSVMSLVDTAFVSRLGTSAIAGVGLAITLSFAMLFSATRGLSSHASSKGTCRKVHA